MIFLQIGSNIGDRFSNLMTCIKNIELLIGKIINKSKIYVSECWGVKNQRDYFNMVVAIKSIYDPNKVFFSVSASSVSPSGPVKIVDFLPFLFLSIAACSAAILFFSSSDTSVDGGVGKGCTGGSGGILGENNDPIII